MKLSKIRRIYPYIEQRMKNVQWQKVSEETLERAMQQKQRTCNCFHNATRIALYNSDKGREILQKRIKVEKTSLQEPSYKIILTPENQKEIYRVGDDDFFNKYFSIYRKYNEIPYRSGNFKESESRNLNVAFDIAVAKMIQKHPAEKPWYLRIYDWPRNNNYEYNKPSRAFKWLTGRKPIQIGEDGYKTNLKSHEKDVLELLNKLGELSPKDYSFVIMTGSKYTPLAEKWHCLPILNIDKKAQTVQVVDKRTGEEFDVAFDSIINFFKAIVGINWKE